MRRPWKINPAEPKAQLIPLRANTHTARYASSRFLALIIRITMLGIRERKLSRVVFDHETCGFESRRSEKRVRGEGSGE
jgi:hypothetical protein